MANHTPEDTLPVTLQSKDHGQLLDVIDLLRSQGISHYVQLPQLIVCGDQSSGKSSVLEAVSGVRFPTRENLCTRFATELVLRRDSIKNVSVAITPGQDRTDEEKEKLNSFKAPSTKLDDFPALVNAAEEVMGLDSRARAFSDDTLRVEITGPEQPHLTLVDLPGLIHSESKQQSTSDIEMVRSLVERYMANNRSIILAVVSAKNDYSNQIVTKFARTVDPRGVRTLGIITKPDTLKSGSGSEKAFLDLAGNKDVFFRLGWHILKNRDFDEKDFSVEERDKYEKQFFSSPPWTSLSPRTVGIDALRPRLSSVLREQIIAELPNLKEDVQKEIQDARNILGKLGQARGTLQEQRLYLLRVSQNFSSLLEAALNGVYVNSFFGDAMSKDGFAKRLRATVQYLLLEFADKMCKEGHYHDIVEHKSTKKTSGHYPKPISRDMFLVHVSERMRINKGCELPGTFNPLIIGDLFHHQASPWEQILDTYSEKIIGAARSCVELVLGHIADEETCESLLREVIDPAFEEYTSNLKSKVQEILLPYQQGHPITYNHYFTETVQKARRDHMMREQTQGMQEADMERYACSEAVDCMQAYYKVALKVVVDNFSLLAIEGCILNSLRTLFSPEIGMNLDETLIATLAAETEESKEERNLTEKKLESLETGLRTLNRLKRRNTSMKDPEDAIMAFLETCDSRDDHREYDREPATVEQDGLDIKDDTAQGTIRERKVCPSLNMAKPSLPSPPSPPLSLPCVQAEPVEIDVGDTICDETWWSHTSSKKGKKKGRTARPNFDE